MSKLIQKAGFLNPNRAGRYMNYIATRDGVELLDENADSIYMRYYAVWNDLRDTLEGYYKSKPRQHNPLSQQKEFRAIKNAIIQEAERLRQQMEQESSQGEEPSAEETSRDASTNPTLADENTSSPTSHSVRLPSEYLLNSTIRLFHQMVQIFRDNAMPPCNPMGIRIDSKRRKKLMQKRLAMGHIIHICMLRLKMPRNFQ